jgi:hypothetical protein
VGVRERRKIWKGDEREIDREGVWVGGRGRDISRMKGGREREEQRWGMRRVGQLIRIYIDLLMTRIQDDGQVEEDTCYATNI